MNKLLVNPMYGYCNFPQLYYLHDEDPPKDEDQLWHKTNNLYWYQLENGITRFLYHNGPLSYVCDNTYRTPNGGGFCGSIFKLNIVDGRIIYLYGPWSSGCYYANSILPKQTMEITWKMMGGFYLTFDVIQSLLPEGWEVFNDKSERIADSFGYCPNLRYNGKTKKQLDNETLKQLQKEFYQTAGYNTSWGKE